MPYKSKEDRKKAEAFRIANRKLRFIKEAGNQCVDCGFNAVPEVLQFHHRDESQKNFDLGVHIGEDRLRAELKLCDLVCPTCHAMRHLVEEEWRGRTARFIRSPHGGSSIYSRRRREMYRQRTQAGQPVAVQSDTPGSSGRSVQTKVVGEVP